ncbi:nuclear transport factor 2 family protein [Actinomycetospora sp. CA-101289]|uniref:nuclear transport factor 2 family protein n=1 Tax=Actinomycetospora sp. CA-101289 TaxID=3239893 RepID=UPI003D996867
MSLPTASIAVDAPFTTDAATTDVVRAACRAWADRDEEALHEHLDPDVLWRAAVGSPYAGSYRGPDEVSVLLRRMAETWPAWEVDVDVIASAAHQGLVVGTYRGRAASTGRSVEARFAQVWSVRDGRVTSHEEIVDSSRLLASLITAQPSIP